MAATDRRETSGLVSVDKRDSFLFDVKKKKQAELKVHLSINIENRTTAEPPKLSKVNK